MCKFESLQKDESGAEQEDSSQAGDEATACFIIVSDPRRKSLLLIFSTNADIY